jgi:CRISPR-associated exonuclease Cas4
MPIDLTVTDLKQWCYCPRIVFYQKLMPVTPPRTYKMARAGRSEARMASLGRRRGLQEYGLEAGSRRLGVRLFSKRWNLTGKLDLLIETPDALYPVEFKDTTGPPRENHTWQLAGYALLLAEAYGKPVPAGFIHRLPDDQVFRIDLTAVLGAEIQRALVEMTGAVEAECIPEPTPVRERCEECEYRNFCGDVL